MCKDMPGPSALVNSSEVAVADVLHVSADTSLASIPSPDSHVLTESASSSPVLTPPPSNLACIYMAFVCAICTSVHVSE